MKFTFKNILSSLSLLLLAGNAGATTRKVLFIGNSYTYTNNMPLMLQNIAKALGDTLIYDESDPGGWTLMQHSTYAPTITKIYSQQWDIVVIHEQSQRPAFPPSQVAADTYPYAHILDSLVHDNNACSQTMFMMTWGYESGDASNCAGYPPICTYAGMQLRLRESYMEMMKDNKAALAPVGAAWKAVRDSFPALNLYNPDKSHPIVTGSYLEACVLYSSIFHKKTTGCTYTSGLSTSDIKTLQHFGDKITLDSLTQWQQYSQYPYAGIRYTRTGSTYSFSNTPTIITQHSWTFGDGGKDTAAKPSHTYATPGKYVVSHTASNSCFTETITDTINYLGTTGISNGSVPNAQPINVVYGEQGTITFVIPADQDYTTLDVLDAGGRTIRHYPLSGQNITDKFTPGFYIYRAYSADRNVSFTNKLVVY